MRILRRLRVNLAIQLAHVVYRSVVLCHRQRDIDVLTVTLHPPARSGDYTARLGYHDAMRGKADNWRRAAFARTVYGNDAGINLALASLLLALERHPELDVAQYLAMLDALAEGAARVVPPNGDAAASLDALGRYLHDGEGFHGDESAYATTDGCFLDRALDQRTGLPITLSVIYLEVGWRLGLPLAGVGMPGHFIIKHEAHDAVFCDPFHGGRVLSAGACAALLGRQLGAGFTFHPEMLDAVGRRTILYRMLNNLKMMYLRSRKLDLALWATDRMLIVQPRSATDVRDRGLLHFATRNYSRASLDLEAYLSSVPNPPDVPVILKQLRAARLQSGLLN